MVESTIEPLSSSETIKTNMEQLIRDTREARKGSSNNVELGQELVRNVIWRTLAHHARKLGASTMAYISH